MLRKQMEEVERLNALDEIVDIESEWVQSEDGCDSPPKQDNFEEMQFQINDE